MRPPRAMLLKNISQIFLQRWGTERQAKTNRERGGVIRKRHQGVRSEARTGAPVGAWITPSLCCACAGERRPFYAPSPKPSPVEAKASAAFQTNQAEPSQPSSKNIKHLTYEATPNSATVNKLCFQPAQAHPRIRHRRIHSLEPQAPLHVHHAERKTKTNVFEVG